LKPFLKIFFIGGICLFFAFQKTNAQFKVRGYVYDSSRLFVMPGVTVMSSSGKGTSTNNEGHYEIEVTEADSIWFSYLGKPTMKYPVLKMNDPLHFDISIQISIPVLKEVRIFPRNYKLDSIRNREDYASIFNYQKPKLKTVTPQYGAAVGFDLDEIINMFRFKRNRSMAAFQKRLLQDELDKFIDHRFSKALVIRLTKLSGNELDSFMRIYRPPYQFTLLSSDYDFQKYIKDSFTRYKLGLPPIFLFRPEEE
jgi:hypothetical protein